MAPVGGILGARVVVSPHIGSHLEQTRFPRTKCKRIRKKWRKDARNWRIVERPEFYRMADGTIIASSAGAELLRAKLPPAPTSGEEK